jgi:hypothetical protein
VFIWGSFGLFMLFDRTFYILLVSLPLSIIGFLFSGVTPFVGNKVLLYFNVIFNWGTSRTVLMVFSHNFLMTIYNTIYEMVVN